MSIGDNPVKLIAQSAEQRHWHRATARLGLGNPIDRWRCGVGKRIYSKNVADAKAQDRIEWELFPLRVEMRTVIIIWSLQILTFTSACCADVLFQYTTVSGAGITGGPGTVGARPKVVFGYPRPIEVDGSGDLFNDQPFDPTDVGTTLTAFPGSNGFTDFVNHITDGTAETVWIGWGDTVQNIVVAGGWPEPLVLYGNIADPRIDFKGDTIDEVTITLDAIHFISTPSQYVNQTMFTITIYGGGPAIGVPESTTILLPLFGAVMLYRTRSLGGNKRY
jgi:hypothetical protein